MSSTTIAERIAENQLMRVCCGHGACHHSTDIDLPALAARLGADHGAMHQDLVGKFRCDRCLQAGRRRSAPFFTVVPDYEGLAGRLNTPEILPAGRGG